LQDLWQKEWRGQQHTEPITKLLPLQTTFSDSNKLISISKDASIKVYRGRDLYPLQTIVPHTKSTLPTTPAWPSDAALLTLGGHQKLVVSSYDRSFAFYNVLLAENDPERPDERSCLGLGARLKTPAPGHAATALGSLPLHTTSTIGISTTSEDQQLVFGDETGKVSILKRNPPTVGLSASLDPKTDFEVLHTHHSNSITQLLHIPHVGLLSSSLDGTIGIFDAERGRIAASTGHLHDGTAVRCMAYHQPLTLAVSGGAGRSALLWHPRGDPGKAVGELPGHVHGVLSISTAQILKSNNDTSSGEGGRSSNTSTNSILPEHAVVTLSGAGTVTVFDLRTLRPLHKLESTGDYPSHEDARPTALVFDQEKQRIVTATKRPCAWSFSDGRELEHRERVSCRKAFSLSSPTPATEAAAAAAVEDEGEQAALLPRIKSATAMKTKEVEEEATWRQAHSRLRLATIPDTDTAAAAAARGNKDGRGS
jgi:WD40 repeat protein